jgi:SAM-dependent methyltransferase
MMHCAFRKYLFPVFLSAIYSFLVVSIISLGGQSAAQDLDVPYVPTPQPVVERMLEMALVDSSDYVIDLGSGDGRIVIAAARRGATGHGIDLDSDRIQEARENARQAEVDDRVLFFQEDIFETDFSQASVITMYLLSSVNIKLRPRLLEELRPGTRVISHSFDMDGWTADMAVSAKEESGGTSRLYLWIIPARMEGRWSWNQNGSEFSMDVDQEFQNVDINLTEGDQTLQVEDAHLKGPRITFSASNGRKQYIYSGHVDDNMLSGTVQIRQGNNSWVEPWSASR